MTFTASIGVALTCGLTYTFSIWSGALKAAYGLRQDQLELIASAANAVRLVARCWVVREWT